MENLVDRARAAMNLILVASLLLAWVALQPPLRKTVELAEEIVLSISSNSLPFPDKFAAPIPSMNVQEFLAVAERHLKEWSEPKPIAPDISDRGTPDIEALTKIVREAYRENLLIRAEPVRELSNIYAKFKNGDEKLTFEQLDERRQSEVRIPFVEQEVPGEQALLLISIGLAGPYLYLLSICHAMRAVDISNLEPNSLSWIFFHPGNLGVGIGVVWLALPPLVLAMGQWLRGVDPVNLEYVSYLVLAVLWGACINQAWLARCRLVEAGHIQSVPWWSNPSS